MCVRVEGDEREAFNDVFEGKIGIRDGIIDEVN